MLAGCVENSSQIEQPSRAPSWQQIRISPCGLTCIDIQEILLKM